jgi:threonine dehydrogenase-like Zn-dependent dehydrogenase
MPYELVAVAPRTPAIVEYSEPDLGDHQVRRRTEFASPKHGTEMVGYRSEAAFHRRYDRELGCMVAPQEPAAKTGFPLPLGNMAVGVVTEVGPEVTRFQPGDRVFGHLSIRETHTVDETAVDRLPDGLTAEAAVCLDPAVMALAMRDAAIRLGDQVAVFGLGAIGLMAVQLARIAGADLVIAVDPLASRRDLALSLGADVVLDAAAHGGDTGLTIKEMTGPYKKRTRDQREATRVTAGYWEVDTQYGQHGVDVAIEVSGNTHALHQAIRATRFGGTICLLSYYGREAVGLRLGDEFHVNRQQLISARVESLPLRDGPAWDLQRLVDLALRWLISGRLSTAGIVTPIVPFASSAEAYRRIDEHPEDSVKLGVRFEGTGG